MNIFDFAIEMENDGYDYYKGLADAATLPGLTIIFSSLAEDELKHAEFFRALKAGEEPGEIADSKALDVARNIFKILPGGTESLNEVSDSLKAYQHAMKLEADSFRFYEEAAAKEKDETVRTLLLKIAEEEHQHFNILENVYHFVNAPNQTIEWGEFSNLGEFRQFGRDVDA